MTQEEYIDKIIGLYFDLKFAMIFNSEKTITEITKELENLMSSAADELTDEELIQMGFVLEKL